MLGTDIFFRNGAYRPEMEEGRKILAHELTHVAQNKYQIVQYNQRKAFLNSAKYEIQRIEKLKKSIKEKELQIEIQYLRFLEKQIRLLKNEIQLNNERERQQRAEILYSFSQYNTGGATYKDRRNDFSSSSYHKIDYYQIFKETL